MAKRPNNFQIAGTVADLARLRGNKEAYDLAISAQWDFDYAMHADERGEHSRAWSKRSSGKRHLNRARKLLGLLKQAVAAPLLAV